MGRQLKFKSVWAVLGLSVILGACGQVPAADSQNQQKNTPTVASQPQNQAKHNQTNLLEDSSRLQAAQQSLQQLPIFVGQPVNVVGNIDFFDGVRPRIELMIQNPNALNEILFLKYESGRWSEPIIDEEATEDWKNKKIKDINLTLLDNIHFEDVVHVAQLWRSKAKEVQAVVQDPYHVAFIWMPKLKKRFWHTAELEAVGAQYYLSVNADGTIWEWKKL